MGTKTHNNYEDLITFTRASGGHALRPVSYGSELITNGTFDTNSDWTLGSGWSINTTTGQLVASSTASNVNAIQTINTVVGKIYSITIDCLTLTAGNIRVYHREGGGGSFGDFVNFAAGQTAILTFVATTDTTDIYLYPTSLSSGTFDNVSVKEVTFDESDGTLTLFEHPDNIPRVEFDADSNRLGLLVEESRTNVIEYSEDLSQWSSGTRITLSATDVTETPDGQRGAYKAVATTLNTNHYFEPVGSTPYLKTTTAGTTWTFSIFAKAAENTVLQIASSSGFLSKYQNFDLTNGVKLSGDVDGSAIQAVGNGWYKCSVTQDTVGTTARFILIPANSDISRNPSFVGDGTSGIYVWGGQAEESASFPTSYIKTTGSTATRSVDVVELEAENFGYNLDAGTFFYEGQDIADNYSGAKNSQGGFHVWFGGDSNNYVGGVYHSGSTGLSDSVYFRGGGTLETANAGTDLSGNGKVAFAYDLGNSISVSVDGSTAVTQTATTPTAYNNFDWKIRLGSSTSGTSTPTSVYVKQLKFYPRRLTDEQIKDLTS